MSYLITIIAGLVGAGAGFIAAGIVEPFVAPWLALVDIPFAGKALRHLDLREVGAVVGLIVAILLALRLCGGHRTKGALAGRGVLAAIISAGLIYGAREAGGALFDTLGLNPLAPVVEFEIRLPPGSKTPATRDDIQIELHTDRNQIIATLSDVARDGDRPVLRGSAPLVFRTTQRMVVMSLPGEPVRVFRLRLPAQPTPSADFGPWQQVDFLEDASQPARRADVTADYSIRYRVN